MKFLIPILALLIPALAFAQSEVELHSEIIVYAVRKEAQVFTKAQFTEVQPILQTLSPMKVKNHGGKQSCHVRTSEGSVEATFLFSAAANAQVVEVRITRFQDQQSLESPVVSAISKTDYQSMKEGQVLFVPAGEVTFILYLPPQRISA